MDTAWGTFAVITGGAAAALLGLLFVAISIRVDVISRSVALRDRAAQTLVLFGTALIVAILLAVPGQALQVLGVELIVLAVATAASLVALDRRVQADSRSEGIARVLDVVDVVTPNAITSLLLLVAGAILLFGAQIGRYVLVVPVLAALIGGVASAWLFMTRVTE